MLQTVSRRIFPIPVTASSATAILQLSRHLFSTDSLIIKSLTFKQHGVPENVLEMRTKEITAGTEAYDDLLGDKDILVKMLASPINPSDINTIEGRYALKPPLPCTPGHEGVGIVQAVGSKVSRMQPGDRIVPIEHGQGTWCSHGIFRENFWYRIPKDLPIATAATMVVNPPTALRLLEEYVQLARGDTVILNGATSAVGKYVVQLCQHMGIHPICVVRERPPKEKAQVVSELKEMGAALVTTKDEVRAALLGADLPAPRLALDCVGGSEATAIAKCLAPGGTMVVYGSMSQKPLELPSSLFIFKDMSVKGFWLTGECAKAKDGWKLKERLVDRVCAMFRQKVLHPVTVDCIPMSEWKVALERYRKPHRNTKVLLTNFPEDACL
jgi:trans-2-enoyl-CoA reductase